MAQVVNGRYTARMDEPFVVFIIGMWLPLHKEPCRHRPPDDPGEVYRGSPQRPYRSTRLEDYAHGSSRARQ
jgi:hypothetical protein